MTTQALPLKDIFTTEKGKNPNKNEYQPTPTPEANVPVITAARGPAGYHPHHTHQGEMLTMSTHGDAGYVNYWNGKQYLGGNVLSLVPKNPEQVHLRYAYHALKAQHPKIKTLVRKGGVPYINATKTLATITLTLPDYETQVKQAQLLDQFLLGAENYEAQARNLRKQYDYYLNKTII